MFTHNLSNLPPGVSDSDPHINPPDATHCVRCHLWAAEYDGLCGGCCQDLHDEAEAYRMAEEHDREQDELRRLGVVVVDESNGEEPF